MKTNKQIPAFTITGIICFAGVVMLFFSVWTLWAAEDQQGPGKPRQSDSGQSQCFPPPRKPPPEAFTICEGKNTGESAQLVTPRGDTITGTCQSFDGILALKPDQPKR
jgi:hypothetical protein